MHSYIFYSGGYIGLFLGYALLQLPDLCFNFLGWLNETFFVNKNITRNPEVDNSDVINEHNADTSLKNYDMTSCS